MIATKVSQQCDENDFKQKLAIEILLFLKKCFPFVDFDPDMIKFPKIKKGYVSSIEGNEMDLSDIPFFSVHHDVFQGTAATSSTSATTASPVPSPSPSPVPSTAQETPSVAVIEEKKEKLEVVPEVEEEVSLSSFSRFPFL